MRLSSTGLGVIAIATVSLLILGPEAVGDARSLGSSDFEQALASLATLILVTISAWIVSCVALSILATRTGAALRLSRAITPQFLRRALFLGAAGALAVGPVSASNSPGNGPDGHTTTSTSRLLDGLRLPDRPSEAVRRATAPPERPRLRTYAVKPGDSLWAIASRDLDPTASPFAVAAEMRRWYEANRDVIGHDPNLIFPGQRLTPPTKDSR